MPTPSKLTHNNLLAAFLLKAPDVSGFQELRLNSKDIAFLEGYNFENGRISESVCQLTNIYKYMVDKVAETGKLPNQAELLGRFPEVLEPYLDQIKDIEFTAARSMVLERFITKATRYSHKAAMKEIQRNPSDLSVGLSKIIDNTAILMDKINPIPVVSMGDSSNDRMTFWKETSQREIAHFPFKTLKKHSFALREGNLIALHSKPKVGKTWFSSLIAAHAGMNGVPTLFVTIEIPAQEAQQRVDLISSRILNEKDEFGEQFDFNYLDVITTNPGIESQYHRYFELMEEINPPLKIVDNSSRQTINTGALELLVRQDKYRLVIIDGIYLMCGGDSLGWEAFHGLIYGIKRMAMRNKIAILITNQSNKEGGNAFGFSIDRAADLVFKLEGDGNSERSLTMVESRTLKRLDYPVNLDFDVGNGKIKEIEYENI